MNTSFLKKYLIESIGTFFIVFTFLSTANPLAIGLMLASTIYIGSTISGSHYNPAVTFALWLRGKFPLQHFPGYMLFQIFGALVASALFYYLSGKIVYPSPMASIGMIKSILIEIIGTFIYCAVTLEITSQYNTQVQTNALIIGLTLAAISFMGGLFSGGAFNPALGIGSIVFDILKGGTSYSFLPIYLIGPFFGSFLASILYQYTHTD